MNRNVESHFSMLPSADIDRSRFDRSQDIKFTGNVGDIIPFFVDEVLPGDTFDITTSKVVRLQTLLTPVMDNIYLDTYWFFVPNRLVWSHWRELMGENSDSAWIPQAEYSVPQLYLFDNSTTEGSGAVKTGDVLDYMGVPVGVSSAYASTRPSTCPEVNALPLRAYDLVYNDWFRDENLVDPVNIQTGDTSYAYYSSYVTKKPYKAAKYHDYFTSALPSPQKGDPVRAPVYTLTSSGNIGGFKIPVYSINEYHNIDWPGASSQAAPLAGRYLNSGTETDQYVKFFTRSQDVSSGDTTWPVQYYNRTEATHVANQNGFFPDNLYGWFSSGSGGALMGMDINDLRYAFQLQKLYERDARGGRGFLCLHVKKIEEKIWKAA